MIIILIILYDVEHKWALPTFDSSNITTCIQESRSFGYCFSSMKKRLGIGQLSATCHYFFENRCVLFNFVAGYKFSLKVLVTMRYTTIKNFAGLWCYTLHLSRPYCFHLSWYYYADCKSLETKQVKFLR